MRSEFPSSAHPTGKCTDREAVARLARRFGADVLCGTDIARARDIGEHLIGETLASAGTLQACQDKAHAVVFGYREDGVLTAMMALLPLNEAGHTQLIEARFDARAPDLELVTSAGETPACYYAWGIAATSKQGARALIGASAALHGELFWAIPSYTRAATNDGLRLMSSFGYRPYHPLDPKMIMAPAPGRPPAVAP